MVGGALITNCESLMLSVSVDVEHYIHDKSFRHRLILLSLRNSKIGEDVLHRLLLGSCCILPISEIDLLAIQRCFGFQDYVRVSSCVY